MSHDNPFDVDPTTPAEFESLLGKVLTAAVASGVDPRGSWVFRDNGSPQDWELIVSELLPDEAAED